jgi:hypothetical protein
MNMKISWGILIPAIIIIGILITWSARSAGPRRARRTRSPAEALPQARAAEIRARQIRGNE